MNLVRDLKGVIEREKAAIGALITLREPTTPMLTEAASAGFYVSENFPEKYPSQQILTIAELLAGKQLRYPRLRDDTFKKAERQKKKARPANQGCSAEGGWRRPLDRDFHAASLGKLLSGGGIHSKSLGSCECTPEEQDSGVRSQYSGQATTPQQGLSVGGWGLEKTGLATRDSGFGKGEGKRQNYEC